MRVSVCAPGVGAFTGIFLFIHTSCCVCVYKGGEVLSYNLVCIIAGRWPEGTHKPTHTRTTTHPHNLTHPHKHLWWVASSMVGGFSGRICQASDQSLAIQKHSHSLNQTHTHAHTLTQPQPNTHTHTRTHTHTLTQPQPNTHTHAHTLTQPQPNPHTHTHTHASTHTASTNIYSFASTVSERDKA